MPYASRHRTHDSRLRTHDQFFFAARPAAIVERKLTNGYVTAASGDCDDLDCNDGGGIGVSHCAGLTSLLVRDVIVDGNASGDDGGGIDLSEVTATLRSVTITDSLASRRWIRLSGHGSAEAVSIETSTITTNRADSGAGISAKAVGVSLDGVSIIGNTATSRGGSIQAALRSVITATWVNISQNLVPWIRDFRQKSAMPTDRRHRCFRRGVHAGFTAPGD